MVLSAAFNSCPDPQVQAAVTELVILNNPYLRSTTNITLTLQKLCASSCWANIAVRSDWFCGTRLFSLNTAYLVGDCGQVSGHARVRQGLRRRTACVTKDFTRLLHRLIR